MYSGPVTCMSVDGYTAVIGATPSAGVPIQVSHLIIAVDNSSPQKEPSGEILPGSPPDELAVVIGGTSGPPSPQDPPPPDCSTVPNFRIPLIAGDIVVRDARDQPPRLTVSPDDHDHDREPPPRPRHLSSLGQRRLRPPPLAEAATSPSSRARSSAGGRCSPATSRSPTASAISPSALRRSSPSCPTPRAASGYSAECGSTATAYASSASRSKQDDYRAVPSRSFTEYAHDALAYFASVYARVRYHGRLRVWIAVEDAETSILIGIANTRPRGTTNLERVSSVHDTNVDTLLANPCRSSTPPWTRRGRPTAIRGAGSSATPATTTQCERASGRGDSVGAVVEGRRTALQRPGRAAGTPRSGRNATGTPGTPWEVTAGHAADAGTGRVAGVP